MVALVVSASAMPHDQTVPPSFRRHSGDLTGHHSDFNGGPGHIGNHQNPHGSGDTYLRNQPNTHEYTGPIYAGLVPNSEHF